MIDLLVVAEEGSLSGSPIALLALLRHLRTATSLSQLVDDLALGILGQPTHRGSCATGMD